MVRQLHPLAVTLTTLYCCFQSLLLPLPPVLLPSLVWLLSCCHSFPLLLLPRSQSFAPRSNACVCTVPYWLRPGRGWVDNNGRLTAWCYPPDTGQCTNETHWEGEREKRAYKLRINYTHTHPPSPKDTLISNIAMWFSGFCLHFSGLEISSTLYLRQLLSPVPFPYKLMLHSNYLRSGKLELAIT